MRPFPISYWDVMLKRDEMSYTFLSKDFRKKLRCTEVALNFVQKQCFSKKNYLQFSQLASLWSSKDSFFKLFFLRVLWGLNLPDGWYWIVTEIHNTYICNIKSKIFTRIVLWTKLSRYAIFWMSSITRHLIYFVRIDRRIFAEWTYYFISLFLEKLL